ncbi:uncharacterized protein LOC126908055 [Daktulosphaira vitifoliae]|uniref:uncharacterized protein LOC126908055 n=1 Tax=Daktulosphaira vitifoliae TaxID=58002 RepID=UPI0021AA80C8|nr:uncharacterized protein LOC126908055 [Daktulosphaira vitifoliae]XP_050545860.1 uncharacterized protein LOC126908055 [Daktulosphaira vitifoliae]
MKQEILFLKANIQKILRNVIEIKLLLKDTHANTQNIELDANFSSIYNELFPLKSRSFLDHVEYCIINESNFKSNLASRIKTFMGYNQNKFMYVALSNLITDQLGTTLSYSGKKRNRNDESKIALKTLELYKLICETARQKFVAYYSENNMATAASSWLRHVCERLKKNCSKQ